MSEEFNVEEKEISLGVEFVSEVPAGAGPRGAGVESLAAESRAESFDDPDIAFADPNWIGVVRRAEELVETGLLSEQEFERATEDGTIHEIVIERSNLLPAWFLDVGAQRARAVCKIEASGVNYLGQSGSWAGTGFMISPNVLVTNHHVLNSVAVARNARCIFNYQVDPRGGLLPTKSFRVNPSRLFITSKTPGGLDCTFVWVDGEPGREFGFVPVDRQYFKIIEREFANIIQHPGGKPKNVTLQENEVLRQDDNVTHYTSDTMPGSSGSCVFNNSWQAVALHHASQRNAGATDGTGRYQYLNEGIKFSAIAAWLEKVRQQDPSQRAAAATVLRLIGGTDEMLGFFGGLGREVAPGLAGPEAVVTSYKGEADDIDVGFWNIEWFNLNFAEKVEAVAKIIISMNLDIWAFSETSPEATAGLVAYLNKTYKTKFKYAASEPDASSQLQTTTVMWNSKTVEGSRRQWPATIDKWFKVHSKNFASLNLEAVEGPVFPRYPGLFYFRAKNSSGAPFDFHLVPLHLKAMGEGSKRRRMAAAILAAAVRKMVRDHGADADWIVGGDYNAELASKDFKALVGGGMVPLSAADEDAGAFSYVKGPKSLIDHIFLSANLAQTYGADDFFIVAKDKTIPGYVNAISDHRPVLVRLSLSSQAPEHEGLPEDLLKELGQWLPAEEVTEVAPGLPHELSGLDESLETVASAPAPVRPNGKKRLR